MPPPALKGYSGQTTDQLLALEDNYRVDSIVLAFEEALLHKSNRELSREEQYVLAVEALEREVNNGGYLQFFTHACEHTAIVEAALRAIDCPVMAQVTHDALTALELEDDFTPDDVAAAAEDADESLREVLEECDNRHFDEGEPIADKLFEWIRRNRKSIRVG